MNSFVGTSLQTIKLAIVAVIAAIVLFFAASQVTGESVAESAAVNMCDYEQASDMFGCDDGHGGSATAARVSFAHQESSYQI